jgi:hypothetical protein
VKVLTGIQLAFASKYFNCDFDGTEWCPHCSKETNFVVNPMKEIEFKCENCGETILPCSLCSGMKCGEYKTCKDAIIAELYDFHMKCMEE